MVLSQLCSMGERQQRKSQPNDTQMVSKGDGLFKNIKKAGSCRPKLDEQLPAKNIELEYTE